MLDQFVYYTQLKVSVSVSFLLSGSSVGRGVITARKRSLGQGNDFTGVCLSTGGSLYDVTSCLAAWSHVPSRGPLSLAPCSFQGVSVPGRMFFLGGFSVQGNLCPEGSLSRAPVQ